MSVVTIQAVHVRAALHRSTRRLYSFVIAELKEGSELELGSFSQLTLVVMENRCMRISTRESCFPRSVFLYGRQRSPFCLSLFNFDFNAVDGLVYTSLPSETKFSGCRHLTAFHISGLSFMKIDDVIN